MSLIRKTTINSNYALITVPNLFEPAVSSMSSTKELNTSDSMYHQL